MSEELRKMAEDIRDSHGPMIDLVSGGASRSEIIDHARGYMARISDFMAQCKAASGSLGISQPIDPEDMPWNARDWDPITGAVSDFYAFIEQLDRGIGGHGRAERVRRALVEIPLTIAFRLRNTDYWKD